MATSTKRRVKRNQETANKAEANKASKRNAKLASLATIKSDPAIKAATHAFETREASPVSMVLWVTDLVRIFADPKKKFGISEEIAAHLVKEESRIRMATRKYAGDQVSERDKTGVSKSQFLGVLRMSETTGGYQMWKMCADIGRNWSVAQEIASKCRGAYKADKKWPGEAFVTKHLNAIRARKIKSQKGGNGKGIVLGGPALAARMLKDAKDFSKRLRSLMVATGCEVQLRALVKNAELVVSRVKAHTLAADKAAKAAKAA